MTTRAASKVNRAQQYEKILAAMADGWTMNQDIAEAVGMKDYALNARMAELTECGKIIRKRRGVYHLVGVNKMVMPEPVREKTGIFGRIISRLNIGLGTD